MRWIFFVVAAATMAASFQGSSNPDLARWQREAQNVTIIRDDWGIAHVYGKTDADAVFGMEYAQAEDDFNRVETNYINAMGRLAEAEGESKIYQDLRMKLFINEETLKEDYDTSPAWLKALMDSFADGLNYYLYKHPQVHPRVIQHFEPWMALSFTEGSIGGDIEKVNLQTLQDFYGDKPATKSAGESEDYVELEPTGSNGMAIAPANSANHRALLLINPHTSFYFRSELQMASGEGLNAYGAATWGQFFIYQGFSDKAGWMHTSSGVNAVSHYLETVGKQGEHLVYKYGDGARPVVTQEITVRYATDQGMAEKKFTTYRTNHGPVIGEQDGKWLAIRLMQEPVKQLEQSFLRTKVKNYKEFRDIIEMRANSSNNTIFADRDGDIAYFHGNYIPKRDTQFDWTKPVDGSNPATDWQGPMAVDATPHLLNPKSGWIYNSNDAPWHVSGSSSPKKEDFPAYVESGGESSRGRHAVRVLSDKKNFTMSTLIGAAYDSYLPWFEKTIPILVKAWDAAPDSDPLKQKTAEQVALLRKWDLRWGVDSVPTSVAVFSGEQLLHDMGRDARRSGMTSEDYIAANATPAQFLQAVVDGSAKLTSDFGTWKTPWGDINRFQRLNDDIEPHFDDGGPSIPVEFTSATWGSLASFGAKAYPNTKKWYGTSGNSFVAVVEFGVTVHARAVTAGGESGKPGSPHFDDEAKRYSTGNLREVYYYREQLKGHTQREYHPGS